MFFEWITNIVGIAVVGILVDILIPEGETNKYIKSVFALLTVLVIVLPLSKIRNTNIDFEDVFSGGEVLEIDESFVKSVYEQKYSLLEVEISKELLRNYSYDLGVDIVFVESCPEKIDVVYLYLKNIVIDDVNENKHIIEKIVLDVSKRLRIKEEKIILRYG